MLEFILNTIVLVFVIFVVWGILVQNQDEQKLWEDRRDYTRMKKFIEENDSSKP